MLKLLKLDGTPHWLQNPSLYRSIKRQHYCYFWTSVVFLKSFYQGFMCHKSLQHRVFYYWKQSSLWFWLWRAIKKSEEEHHLTNELANGDSACWPAPGFTLVWSKTHLKYHRFKSKLDSLRGLARYSIHTYTPKVLIVNAIDLVIWLKPWQLQFKFPNHLPYLITN